MEINGYKLDIRFFIVSHDIMKLNRPISSTTLNRIDPHIRIFGHYTYIYIYIVSKSLYFIQYEM